MGKPSVRVVWTETATRDLEGLIRYLAREAPINAGTVLDRLQSQVELLASVPERGGLVRELLRHGLAIWRALLVEPYRILDRLDGQTAHVFAVLDARRDLEECYWNASCANEGSGRTVWPRTESGRPSGDTMEFTTNSLFGLPSSCG